MINRSHKKKTNKFLNLLILGLFTQGAFAQVKVGDNPTNVNSSAMFEIESTTKGLLIPRMSTGERNAINAPANGLMIFNTTTNAQEINTGTSAAPVWIALRASKFVDGTTTPADAVFTGGNVGIGTTSPNALAALDINGASKGVLFPRMTTAERTALTATAPDGLMVYDTDRGSLFLYRALSSNWNEWGAAVSIMNNGGGGMRVNTFGTSGNISNFYLSKFGGTTLAPTAVSNNDRIGFIAFAGADGVVTSGVANAADGFRLESYVDGSVTAGSVPVRLNFDFMAEGATTRTTAMTMKSAGNIGMGTTAPNASAKLDITSTTQGFLPPRMTQAQTTAIASPAEGLVVYCTDCVPKGLFVFDGAGWASSSSSSGNPAPLVEAKADFTSTLIGSVLTSNKVYFPNGAGAETATNYQWYRANDKSGAGKAAILGATTTTYTIVAADVDKWIGLEIISTAANNENGKSPIEWIPAQFTFNGKTYAATRGSFDGPDANTIGDYIWLDRNLGANQVATSATDFNAYGDWYQWGRLADGHEAVTWTSATACTFVGTTSTLSTTDVPGNSLFIIGNPTGPILGNWRNPVNNTLWNAPGFVNSPAPPGFRVPEVTVFANEATTFVSQNVAGAFASRLKLTAAGRRNSTASAFERSTHGYYKSSSTLNASTPNSFTFVINATSVSTNTGRVQAEASSVRCILQ